jgi:hypothetical protein
MYCKKCSWYIRCSLWWTSQKARTVASMITWLKSLWLLYVGHTGRKSVCVNNPHPLEKLQENIRHDISTIPVLQHWHVSGNLLSIWGMLRSRGLSLWDSSIKSCVTAQKWTVNYQLPQGILCKKSAMSSAAASLRIICPPCICIYMTSIICKELKGIHIWANHNKLYATRWISMGYLLLG